MYTPGQMQCQYDVHVKPTHHLAPRDITLSLIPTLMQLPATSSMRLSKRVQSADVHCGNVTFVGSVRTRDRYSNPCDVLAESVCIGQLVRERKSLGNTWVIRRNRTNLCLRGPSKCGSYQRLPGFAAPLHQSGRLRVSERGSVTHLG